MLKLNQILAISVLGFSALALNACSDPVTEISTVPVERPQLIVPEVDPVTLREVRWVVLTEDTYQDVLQTFEHANKPFILFSLNEDGYRNLVSNINDLKVMIEQQHVIIAAYDAYYGNEAL